jgi:hypothetical protein
MGVGRRESDRKASGWTDRQKDKEMAWSVVGTDVWLGRREHTQTDADVYV